MPSVEFYATEWEGPKLVGRITFNNGRDMIFDLPKGISDELQNEGVELLPQTQRDQVILFPKDGIAFLKAIPVAYSGAYLRARYID